MPTIFSPAPLVVLLLAAAPALLAWPSRPASFAGAAIWIGWLGTGLISTSLLLTLRAPAFAGWFGGFGQMYRWHHRFGTLGYTTLLLHPLALAARSLPNDTAGAWVTLSPAAQDWIGLLGWFAMLGLMAGLGSTFLLRLPYLWWRRLHATLAVAVLLGIGHVFAVGDMTASAWLVLAPIALALAWRARRVIQPDDAAPTAHTAAPATTNNLSPPRMRRLFLVVTIFFLLVVTGLWLASLR